MIAPQPAASGLIFVSYAREDTAFVERFASDLREAGVKIWIDTEGLKPGTRNWEKSLREAIGRAIAVLLIASPDSRRSDYVQDELAIAEMCGRPIFPVWAQGEHWIDCIPMGMGKMQFVDVRGDYYHHGMRNLITALDATQQIGGGVRNRTTPPPFTLAEVLGSAPIVEAVTATHLSPLQPDPAQWRAEAEFVPRNPYKGLRAFREDDQGDFFGRDRFLDELLEALATPGERILPVIGPSGSGKSSVVMAGLLPRLHQGAFQGSDTWYYLPTITPTDHPLERLAVAIKTALPQSGISTIQNDLAHAGARGLHLLTSQIAGEQGASRVALYIDQFEEIFTQLDEDDAEQENERRQFINLLTTAVGEPKGALVVILTMRADFYDRPMNYPELGRIMEKRGKSVYTLSLAELYEVIQRPAALKDVQLAFDDGLLVQLVFDVRDQAGGLPLLQFALDQLFGFREGQRLTMAAYQSIGGVRGALTSHAESTYTNLGSDNQRAMARSLFLRLIEPGATELDTTRRRARLEELEQGDPQQQEDMQYVIDTFVNSRLLMTDHGASGTTIEVSHEALIREWKRLSGWLEEARDDINLQQEVSADVREWHNRDRPADRLYRGAQLADALEWSRRARPSVSEVEFLGESELAEARFHRRQRIRNLAMVALAILIPIIAAAALFILNQEKAKSLDEIQTTQAEAFPLLANSLLSGSNPDVPRALEVALDAVSYGDTYYRPEGHVALINALGKQYAGEPGAFTTEKPVNTMTWNAEHTHFLTVRNPPANVPCPSEECFYRIDVWNAKGERLDIGLPNFEGEIVVQWLKAGEDWNTDGTLFWVFMTTPLRSDCTVVECEYTGQVWDVDGQRIGDELTAEGTFGTVMSPSKERVALIPYDLNADEPKLVIWDLVDGLQVTFPVQPNEANTGYNNYDSVWSPDETLFYLYFAGDLYVASFENGLVPLMNDGGSGFMVRSVDRERIVTVDSPPVCEEDRCPSIVSLWDSQGQLIAADLPHAEPMDRVTWTRDNTWFIISTNFTTLNCEDPECIYQAQAFDKDGKALGDVHEFNNPFGLSLAVKGTYLLVSTSPRASCETNCGYEVMVWDIETDTLSDPLIHPGTIQSYWNPTGTHFSTYTTPPSIAECGDGGCEYQLALWDINGQPVGDPMRANGQFLAQTWNKSGDALGAIITPEADCAGAGCGFEAVVWGVDGQVARYPLPMKFDNRLNYGYVSMAWNASETHLLIRIAGAIENTTLVASAYTLNRESGTLQTISEDFSQVSVYIEGDNVLLMLNDLTCVRDCRSFREVWVPDENGTYIKAVDDEHILWNTVPAPDDPFIFTLDYIGRLNTWRAEDANMRPFDPADWEPTSSLLYRFEGTNTVKLMMVEGEPTNTFDYKTDSNFTTLGIATWNDSDQPRYLMTMTGRFMQVWDATTGGMIVNRGLNSDSTVPVASWDPAGEYLILHADDREVELVMLNLEKLRDLAEIQLGKVRALAAEATAEAAEAGGA